MAEKDEKTNVSLTMSVAVLNAVKAMAEKENRSVSNMIETILIGEIKRYEK